MENLEKVELVREKCKVSYEEARDALEACGYDVLEAIVMLERAQETTARFAEATPPEEEAEYEPAPDSAASYTTAEPRTSKASGAWKRFCDKFSELWDAGLETSFVAERNGEELFAIPMTLFVLGLLLCGASLWLLIAGLFLGCRYHIEGVGHAVHSVNDAMGKAADAAESVKQSIA